MLVLFNNEQRLRKFGTDVSKSSNDVDKTQTSETSRNADSCRTNVNSHPQFTQNCANDFEFVIGIR